MVRETRKRRNADARDWSGRRDLNPRLRPWQGRTLPLSYSRARFVILQHLHLSAKSLRSFARFAGERSFRPQRSGIRHSENPLRHRARFSSGCLESSREPSTHRPFFRTVKCRIVGQVRLPDLSKIFFRDFGLPSVYHRSTVSFQIIAPHLILL